MRSKNTLARAMYATLAIENNQARSVAQYTVALLMIEHDRRTRAERAVQEAQEGRERRKATADLFAVLEDVARQMPPSMSLLGLLDALDDAGNGYAMDRVCLRKALEEALELVR